MGFEDIAGFSSGDIYAVGWGGEIWRYEKGQWRRLRSPVASNLNAVCCAPDGYVYVAGDDGAFLKGLDDKWEVIEVGSGRNLLNVAALGNAIYAVSDFEIFKLSGDKLVADKAFAKEGDAP